MLPGLEPVSEVPHAGYRPTVFLKRTLRLRAMANRSPTQRAARRRIEGALRLAAPFLDLVLAAGDRISRLADRS
jgi:hypothetical protein